MQISYRRQRAIFSLLVFGLVPIAQTVAANQRPGNIQRVSLRADGTQATNGSFFPAISDDGRFVAFESLDGLVPEDTNGVSDVYVHERVTGRIELVSIGFDGSAANGGSGRVTLSADGSLIGFTSFADNLVSGDTNQVPDMFVRDRAAGITERVNVNSNGEQANDGGFAMNMSADGRYVVYDSVASNLDAGDSGRQSNIFLRDRLLGTTMLITRALGGGASNGISGESVISADGSTVAFVSFASNLVSNDINNTQDVFIYDVASETITRANITADGFEANNISFGVDISADGRFVVFQSQATNLVSVDLNNQEDTFVKDRVTGRIERVSITADGLEASSFSDPSISDDGRFVSFNSVSSSLNPNSFGQLNVYMHDRLIGNTEVISQRNNIQGMNTSWHSAVGGSGRVVVFESEAAELVEGDTNGVPDVYMRDRGSRIGVLSLESSIKNEFITVSGLATIDGIVLSSASDSTGDSGLDVTGADILGAMLAYRPELKDLLVRVDVTNILGVAEPAPLCTLPCAPGVSGLPGIVYALSFDAGGIRYEVRILRVSATNPGLNAAMLFRCDLVCEETATLQGVVGEGGDYARARIPLSLLNLAPGDRITAIQASTGIGESLSGSAVVVDEVQLPNTTMPAFEVRLGVAPASLPAGAVAFTTRARASLVEGTFFGVVDASTIAKPRRVWARACLGAVCGARSEDGEEGALTLPEESLVNDLVRLLADDASFADGVAAFDLRIENTSQTTILTPLRIEVVDISSSTGNVTAANADNGATGPGALWNYDAQVGGDGELSPAETTGTRRLAFTNNGEPFGVVLDVIGNLVSDSGGAGSGIGSNTDDDGTSSGDTFSEDAASMIFKISVNPLFGLVHIELVESL